MNTLDTKAIQLTTLHRQGGLFVQRQENAHHLMVSEPGAQALGLTFRLGEEPAWITDVVDAEMYVETGDGRRPYFVLRREGAADLWAADLRVEAASIENFRDMGGYLTTEGRVVRWGRFFRGGALVDLQPADRQVIQGLDLRYVVDYRSRTEVSRKPDEIGENTTYLHFPAIQSSNPKVNSLAESDMAQELREAKGSAQIQEVLDAFVLLYRELPFDNQAYRAMLGTLDDLDRGSMMQHCSAGKDRTGVGCALLLLALGVEEQTVMQDYLLSTVFRYAHNQRFLAMMQEMGLPVSVMDALAQMLRVSPELLGASLDEIKKRYGGYERFFAEEYGADTARLQHWRQAHTLPAC